MKKIGFKVLIIIFVFSEIIGIMPSVKMNASATGCKKTEFIGLVIKEL